MIKTLPPMGWNTWNTFAEKINEELILASADKLVETGLKDAGYEYVIIDDCWALRERDKNGKLVPDPEKFPHGMKYVADYIHKKGLKFGMYSCCGTMTCAGYPASYDHEFIDAATFAEWGVDFLKYDYCFRPSATEGKLLYRRMGLALANCGRDILFSGCSWGADNTHEWIGTTGANMWRSTGDIFDTWESLKSLILAQYDILPFGRHGYADRGDERPRSRGAERLYGGGIQAAFCRLVPPGIPADDRVRYPRNERGREGDFDQQRADRHSAGPEVQPPLYH